MKTLTTHKIPTLLFIIGFLFGQLTITAQEICGNRIDDDGDGLIDCFDPDCNDDVACWQCATEFYQVHSNSYLVALNPYTGSYISLGTISGAEAINGAQFNQVDGHVYAPCIINGEHKLGMLYQDGSVTDTGLSLPGSNIFYVGAIDANGVMFVSGSAGIYSINLNQEVLVANATGVSNPGVADFALDITNGLFYGITGGAQLKVFDPFSYSVSTYDLAGTINSESGGFGAAWSSNDGSFFAYNNASGKIYTIDPVNLTATEVLNGTGNLSINDGFNCVLAPPPFESNCANGIDDDGDGLADCDDTDCYSSNQCTVEICNNGIDDDNDGWVDCSDSECFSLEICLEICGNGIDDNGNGLVDSDDPQCGTPPGVSGGLESNRRLSQKILKRNFETRILNPDAYNLKVEGIIPFQPNSQRGDFEIAAFIPTTVDDLFITESTPLDLVGITNATEVAAADYYNGNQRVASILGIYSEEGVYEHTKYICDRLDGSRLLDISYLFARGGNFISYELINKAGQKEYAVSFAGYYEAGIGFHIENHWNLSNYKANESYYNYQIWASSYAQLIQLLESVLDNMSAAAPIKSIVESAIPRVFIMQGKYQNGALNLTIKNKNHTPSLDFHGMLSRVEGGELEDIQFTIPLSGSSEELVIVNTGHLYDMGAAITSPGSPDDEIFLADGGWGVDRENPNAEVINFIVSPETEYYQDQVYQVERAVKLEANVKDYLTIYRALDAKYNAKNLSQFNSLAFNASGKGRVEVTLVKSSINNWTEQFRTGFDLESNTTEVILTKGMFSSTTVSSLQLNDIVAVVFTIIGDNANFEQKTIDLSNVRFQVSATTAVEEEETQPAYDSVFPNPARNSVEILANRSVHSSATITLCDALGKVVLSNSIENFEGQSSLRLNLQQLKSGLYFYTIRDSSGNAGNGKFLVEKE